MPFTPPVLTGCAVEARREENCRDAARETAWGHPLGTADRLRAAFAAGDKHFVVVEGTGQDTIVVAFDAATGAHLWHSEYDHHPTGYDAPRHAAASPSGSTVVVSVSSYSPATRDPDHALVAFSADSGTILWSHRHGGQGLQEGHGLAVSDYEVYSVVEGLPGGRVLAAHDLATGALLWTSPLSARPEALSAAFVLPMAVVGKDIVTLADNWASSTPLQAPPYDAAIRDFARFSADGQHVLVGGRTIPPAPCGTIDYVLSFFHGCVGERDMWIALHDVYTGNILWSAKFGQNGSYDTIQDIAFHDNDVIVYWKQNDASRVSRIDSAGQELWRGSVGAPLTSFEGISFAVRGNEAIVTGIYEQGPSAEPWSPARWHPGVALGAVDLDFGWPTWHAVHGPPAGWQDRPGGLFVDASGNAVVAVSRHPTTGLSGLGQFGVPDTDVALIVYS